MTQSLRILLITHNTMTTVTGGTILIRNLVKRIPTENLVWAAVAGSDPQVPDWMSRFEKITFQSWTFTYLLSAFARRTFFGRVLWWWHYRLHANRVGLKIESWMATKRIDKIWLLAAGAAIPVSATLCRKTGLPFHITVHDDIEGHNSASEADILGDDFKYLLENASTSDLTSTSMWEYYQNKYQAPLSPLLFWNGFVDGEIPPAPVINKQIRTIGYAGNIWSPDNFHCLADALASLNAKREVDNQISIVVFSDKLRKHLFLTSPLIKYEGFVEPDKISAKLQKCDLLYAPMGFKSKHEVLARTSLPGKILSYMKAQIPILSHGPTFATNIDFVNTHRVGLSITTQDKDVVASEILRYEQDYESRVVASKMSRELSLSEFSPSTAWMKFEQTLFSD